MVVACVIVSLFYFEWIASVICTEFEKNVYFEIVSLGHIWKAKAKICVRMICCCEFL